MKNIEFKRQLKRLLESQKNRETLKRLIKEGDEQNLGAMLTWVGDPSQSLKNACFYNCFKQGTTMKSSIPGLPGGHTGMVALSESTKYPGYKYAVLVPFSPGKTTGQLIYADETLKKFKVDGTTGQPFIGSWTCPTLTPLLNNSMNPAFDMIIKQVKDLFTTSGYPDQFKTFQEGITDASLLSKGYKTMTLKQVMDTILQDENLKQQILRLQGASENADKLLVYVKGAERQLQGDRTTEDIEAWKAYEYEAGPCKYQDEAFCTQIDLSDCKLNPTKDVNGNPLCKKYTAGQYYVHQNVSGRGEVYAKQLDKDLKELTANNYGKEFCKKYLQSYVNAYDAKIQINQRVMFKYKNGVDECLNEQKGKGFKILGMFNSPLQKKLEGMQYNAVVSNRAGYTTNYSLALDSGSSTPVRESYRDRELKNLIRESLLDIKQTKKKINLGENKIINSRIKLISEHRTLKTKSQKDKFFNELMMEMAYLNSQGYDSQLINENFLDMLKGLFGTAADSTLQYFKESIAKWLIEKLTPMEPNGWMANIIIAAVGNVPIGEISRLTECNYLSDVLTKSIVEGAVNKYKNEQGLTGPFYDILRNGIIEMLEDTKFGQVIETAIGDLVCPLLGGIKDKMTSASDMMKKGALSLT